MTLTTLVDAFAAAATERGCRVTVTASEAEAVAVVRTACMGRPTIADAVAALGGVRVGEPCEDPWLAEVGVTSAWAAASETGTVALVQRPGYARQTAILPLTSVVLVDSAQLLPTYADLVGAVAALDPRPASVQFVTGPSRSGDVQGIVVRGMHGPADVLLVVY